MNAVTPIDPMDLQNLPLFSNLQGNILKGHGRDHTTHIFVRFYAKRTKAARHWLKKFTEEHVTSFQKQLTERERFKRTKVGGSLFASIFLTKSGYEYLGFKDTAQKLTDQGFQSGMRGRLAETKDPTVKKWEKGFRQSIHAMILLADDDQKRMGLAAKELLESLTKLSEIRSLEYGNAIRNANGDGIEHFGYVDGVSQPLFLKDEVDDYMKFHNIPPQAVLFDPTADKDLVLVKDPYTDETNSYGSYFVFRKLEQNVKKFKEAEEEIGKALYPKAKDEEKRELAGAYLVGRFEDGTPVVLSDEEGMIGSGNFNNFNYKAPFDDPSGGRCPHFAHIRKTNSRSDDDKKHTMARRGIPFGHRNVDTALDPCSLQMPEGGVGLLFMSYQAKIVEQFEKIQQMANNLKTNMGIDPIIGHGDNESRRYAFPKQYDSSTAGTITKSFDQFVTMKGGEYFFVPSIPFLENL